jgi:ATP-binding cassette, subfamily B, multidrug efflux pump
MSIPNLNSNFKDRDLLVYYFKKNIRTIGIGISALFLVNLTLVLPTLIIKEVVDGLLGSITRAEILFWAIAYFLLSVVQAGLRYIWSIYLLKGSTNIENDLRNQIFSSLLRFDYATLNQKKSGEVMTLVSSDVTAFKSAFDGGMIVFFDSSLLLTTFVAMFYISPELTIYSLIFFPLIPLIVKKSESFIKNRFTKVQESFAKLISFAQESLSGLRVVRSFAVEERFNIRFKSAGEEYLKKSLHLAKVEATLTPLLELIVILSLVLVLILGGNMVAEGTMTVGGITAFIRYIQQLKWPAQAIGIAFSIFQRAMASSRRISAFLISVESTTRIKHSPPLTDNIVSTNAPALKIQNLNFNYDNSPPLLKNIGFELKQGEKIAIVGDVGSGKSTLGRIIAGLYPVADNSVFLFGKDINCLPRQLQHELITLVPQDAFLFSGSIKKNLGLGFLAEHNPSYSAQLLDKINLAADTSAIKREIEKMENGFDTLVGERGINLSGGQRQRLTIARALLRDSKLIIFDDSLSAVDINTERQILNNLSSNYPALTKIFITHRLSTALNADRMILLLDGEIAISGTHEECLKHEWYRNFYAIQSLEEALND